MNVNTKTTTNNDNNDNTCTKDKKESVNVIDYDTVKIIQHHLVKIKKGDSGSDSGESSNDDYFYQSQLYNRSTANVNTNGDDCTGLAVLVHLSKRDQEMGGVNPMLFFGCTAKKKKLRTKKMNVLVQQQTQTQTHDIILN